MGTLLKITDPSQGYKVEEVIIHKNFTKPCYCNDIALLRLVEPVDSSIIPICLPTFDTAAVGENTTLLGWGDTKFMGGAGTIVLLLCNYTKKMTALNIKRKL